jgi:hypothetical protein
MFRISKDSPVYYLTSVTNTRLPVFRTSKPKDCSAKQTNNFLFFLTKFFTPKVLANSSPGLALKPWDKEFGYFVSTLKGFATSW